MHPLSVVLAAAWAGVVGSGFWMLADYDAGAGPAGDPPRFWPAGVGIARDPELPTLVMLVHPRCPCTRASISELERLVARCHGRVTIHVLFLAPADRADDWAETDLWRSAAAIPGVRVARDREGAAARRLGLQTSGHVLLYGRDGALRFSGGVTAARGHAGDNAGRSAIVDWIVEGTAGRDSVPVFGCGLMEHPEPAASRAEESTR